MNSQNRAGRDCRGGIGLTGMVQLVMIGDIGLQTTSPVFVGDSH
jgi:hypothetical protein